MESTQSTIQSDQTDPSEIGEGVSLDEVTNGQPLKEIIGMRNGRLDLSQFDQLMHEVVSQSAKNTNEKPYKLVRVILNGKVKWTTVAQAKEQIQNHREQNDSDQVDDITKEIEKAMHGDVNYIEDELLVLLCVAHTGLSDNEDAVKKFNRRHEEIVEVTSEIRETEKELVRRKKSSEIISDFEDKMGLMMQANHDGNKELAIQLAAELRSLKSKYVLQSRALMPIVSNIQAQRTGLVKTKEKLLSNMIQQLEQREEGISMNMQMLAQSIEKVEETFKNLTKQEKPADPEMITALNERLGKLKTVMDSSSDKMGLISCEKAALQEELKTTQAVVKEMDKSIDEDHSEELIKKAQGPKIETSKHPSSPANKTVTRMTRQSD